MSKSLLSSARDPEEWLSLFFKLIRAFSDCFQSDLKMQSHIRSALCQVPSRAFFRGTAHTGCRDFSPQNHWQVLWRHTGQARQSQQHFSRCRGCLASSTTALPLRINGWRSARAETFDCGANGVTETVQRRLHHICTRIGFASTHWAAFLPAQVPRRASSKRVGKERPGGNESSTADMDTLWNMDNSSAGDEPMWSQHELIDIVAEPHQGRKKQSNVLKGGLEHMVPTADGILPDNVPHPCVLEEEDLLKQCKVVRTRRGGPGGQHRNKVSTAVVLTHQPSRLTAEASERRSQVQNFKVALGRLRMVLAVKLRTFSEPNGWSPGLVLVQRCSRKGTLDVSLQHKDFATVLADVLDGFEASEYRLSILVDKIDSALPNSHRKLRRNDMVLFLAKVTITCFEQNPLSAITQTRIPASPCFAVGESPTCASWSRAT